MSENPATDYMTVDEYLSFEQDSDLHHEYVDGQVFAMSGSTQAHNVICGNLFSRLHQHLQGTGCRAFINDMKVHVKAANTFYYPDIMVTCEPFIAKSVFTSSPALIMEVLSPSTQQIDRREKLVAYRKLDNLKEYILVHQNKMLLEVYQKGEDGRWQLNIIGAADKLLLESLPSGTFEIPVREIYGDIELPLIVKEEVEDFIYSNSEDCQLVE